jgi:hypothetical protein
MSQFHQGNQRVVHYVEPQEPAPSTGHGCRVRASQRHTLGL